MFIGYATVTEGTDMQCPKERVNLKNGKQRILELH
jgi:hypothetical protein